MSLKRTEDLGKSIRSLQETYRKKHDTITALRADLIAAEQVGFSLDDLKQAPIIQYARNTIIIIFFAD